MAKLYGLNPNQEIPYVPKMCREEAEEDQPVFLLKFLTVKEHSDIQDELFQSSGFGKKRQERFLIGKQTWLTLRIGLKGWRNFKFEDGTEVAWEDPSAGRDVEDRNRIMDKNLNKISPDIRAEMSEHIRGESTLGEAE